MLIDFRYLFPKYGIKPKGVLHVGANVGEEFPVYMELGITKQIWIEANTEIYLRLKQNIKSNPDAHALCAVVDEVSDKEVKFNISNNAGQSSSILELGTHKDVHPDVSYVQSERRFTDSIADIYNIMLIDPSFNPQFDKSDYDFLNIDLQGAELKALKGMGELLHGFKWAYLEVNKAHLYVGCPLIEELDEYLANFGFERVETSWAGNTNWGDALWIKKNL